MIGRAKGHSEESISDEALISGIAVGDEQASLAFVRRYQGRLFGLAISIVRDTALAEDVAQEAFIRIIRHAAVFDPRRGSVASWALTITRNLAVDVLRVRRGTPTDPDDQVFLELMSSEPAPDEAAMTGSAVDRARAGLAQLPLEQRRAVVLAAMYGWTAQEIATEDGIPLGTAKGRIRVGMAKLRESVVIEEAP
ncbi:MAG TPA: sigma-70 family RNA polymerase sigma factor [Acidimicrobiales bacterium]|jgi:RNA polymerase sigma-70 factor (ECF subfamily)|nr:sigma-70 family RNA polymerase sigma factor [Acidimicrobiales bacterium]